MSITPGWLPEDQTIKDVRKLDVLYDGFPEVHVTEDEYFLDQWQEYRRYPRTPEGWQNLCDDLKDFEV
jgi:hypothetical protein